MCCIFTCFGWLLDLLQRCWIFFMSCCISSAVCCVLLTASTSGIALGYNYSLAEYIDLKETNISVFIKRGVFDDEIADDFEWRRSGVKPDLSNVNQDTNLRAGASSETGDTTIGSGRRLDDSIYESQNQNNFEGSLMRLTAKLPYQPTQEPNTVSVNYGISELLSEFPPGSLDQLKAVQTIINARKAAQWKNQQLTQQPDARRNLESRTMDKSEEQIKFLEQYPGLPGSFVGSARRAQNEDREKNMQRIPYRDAVPRMELAGWPKGAVPKSTHDPFFNDGSDDFANAFTFPRTPPTVKSEYVRPPKPPSPKQLIVVTEQYVTRTAQARSTTHKEVKAFNEDLDRYKQRLLINQYDSPNIKADDSQGKRPGMDEYDDDFKGTPIRRKRSVSNVLIEQKSHSNISNSNNMINQNYLHTTVSIESKNNFTTLSSVFIHNTTNIDVDKQHHSSMKTQRKQSIHSAKRKRKNVRKKSRKQNKKPKVNRIKKRRKKQQTSKMTRNPKDAQKKWRTKIIYLMPTSPHKSVKGHNLTSL